RNELADICINLHAFFVNICGYCDNLAWTIVCEKGLDKKLNKMEINLFSEKIIGLMDEDMSKYLKAESMAKWQKEHLKDYRDALSHRIPLYVPPEMVNQESQEILEGPAPFYIHSLLGDNKYVVLHPQIIVDFKTVLEIGEKFSETLTGCSEKENIS
ncbi:MAG: hypothetical protein PHT95_04670, partial [Candidatus Omnitrophica bacterium]|nr:hypothetical protein [Candidatus Omnitrophota bacterium]